MKVIIYTNREGILVVVNLPGIGGDIEKKAWDALPSDAINPRLVDEREIPTNRTFRNAWLDNGVAVDHNMVKAREIHKDHLRQAPAPKMRDQVDIDFLKSLEAWLAAQPNVSLELRSTMVKKQALRDVTIDPAIEAAKTPEELIAAWPEILK